MENNTSYIGALGNLLLFNYSHNPSGVAVDTKANTILVSGEAIAEAKAETEAFWNLFFITLYINKPQMFTP